jgi:hypothetical protein
MKLKSLLLAAMLAVSSVGAMAATSEYSIPLSAVGNTWTAGYSASHTAGEFTDIYTFTPSVTGLADATFFNISYTPVFGIDFTSADLNGVAFTFVNSTPFPGAALTSSFLLPTNITGPLVLTISGIANTNASYAGTLNVLAVPEPETYAMMLGGLGLLGFMARRRKQG